MDKNWGYSEKDDEELDNELSGIDDILGRIYPGVEGEGLTYKPYFRILEAKVVEDFLCISIIADDPYDFEQFQEKALDMAKQKANALGNFELRKIGGITVNGQNEPVKQVFHFSRAEEL
ncbi:hypothetical protein EV207_12161 [Scopulibacillus darangshiensis]|uniref:Uncharacterized protein n=1 Tax=Scopulibacillus darangshiensis TaxID=442528 RepID=A0A4R2NVK2_9BACL|nr:hypothetical protein [Scopulibacillus darangshiensis]TCP25631.1 hypothetical protein EV207_12161 [Scopulibacillus darangshiensis]